MCTYQPTFKKRHDPIYQWQQVVSHAVIFSDNLVDIAQSFKSSVTTPTVCTNNGSRFNTFLNRRSQTICSSIVYFLKTDSSDPISILLGDYKYQCFPCSPSTTINGFLPTDISFINFNSASEAITPCGRTMA